MVAFARGACCANEFVLLRSQLEIQGAAIICLTLAKASLLSRRVVERDQITMRRQKAPRGVVASAHWSTCAFWFLRSARRQRVVAAWLRQVAGLVARGGARRELSKLGGHMRPSGQVEGRLAMRVPMSFE